MDVRRRGRISGAQINFESVMNPVLGVCFNILGFGVGALVYFLEAKRRKMDFSRTTEVAMIGVLVGVVLATVSQLIYNFAVLGHFSALTSGGRTIVGGVLGGWVAVEIAKKRLGIKESTGPLWALALPAGEFFGRIGCWFHGCCFGHQAELPWSVYQHDAWRHPTQFYLAGAAAISFSVIWYFRDRTDVFALSLLLWAGSRIVIEPLRESSSPSPWLVPAICAGIATFAIYRLTKSWKINLLKTTQS